MKFSIYKLYEPFDLTQYKNTRFMYNPNTKQIILGSFHDDVYKDSHADLYYTATGGNKGYDDFYIKGWLGFAGRKYQKGIIHFAPNIRPEQSEVVMQAITLIEKLKNHGFTDNTWVRGLVRFDEYKIKDMYEKIQNWEDDVKPYRQQLQDWVNCSFVKDKVYKIAEGVYTSDKMKARYHNSDLKPYFLRIECPKILNSKLTESFDKLSQKGFDGIIQGKTYRVFNETKQVKEANAQKDYEERNKYKKVFDILVYTIKKKPSVGKIVGSDFGFGYFMNITPAIETLYPEYYKSNPKELYFLIGVDTDESKASFQKFDTFNVLRMNILSDESATKLADAIGSKKSVQNQLIKNIVLPNFINEKTTFIHEFTHAIDDYRMKNYKGRVKSQIDQSNTEYLSDPLEFNAWFQSNMYDWDLDANNMPEFKKDWKLFYSYVLDCLPFVKDYNEKYRRKFDVRLWKYWNEFIKEGVEKKQVNEALKNEGGYFITNKPADIINLCINKPKEYRIVYDSNINLYMICDANEGIHQEMLEKAYRSGLYYKMDNFIEQLGAFQNYIETGQTGGWDADDNEIDQYLFYIIFDPKNNWQLGDDEYDSVKEFSFGKFFTRGCELEETPLYNEALKHNQLNEAFIQGEKGNIYYTKSDTVFLSLVKSVYTSKNIPTRIVYDRTKHLYMFGNAFDYIHTDLLDIMKAQTDEYSGIEDMVEYRRTNCTLFQIVPSDEVKKYTMDDGYTQGWILILGNTFVICRHREHNALKEVPALEEYKWNWLPLEYYEYKNSQKKEINEGVNDNYLYHALWKKQFIRCKKDGKLYSHIAYENNGNHTQHRTIKGISMSRDFRVCMKFMENQIREMTDEWDIDPQSYFVMRDTGNDGTEHYIDKGSDLSYVVLVFDRNKLKQNHKIIPHSYLAGGMRDSFGDEQEELVVGDIPNFMNYVVDVVEFNNNVNSKTLKSKKNLHEGTEPKLNDNFWKWFRGSKVVDKKGNPLVCYHETNVDFNSFDISKQSHAANLGYGFYFSSEPFWSNLNVDMKYRKECYLRIKNPFDASKRYTIEEVKFLFDNEVYNDIIKNSKLKGKYTLHNLFCDAISYLFYESEKYNGIDDKQWYKMIYNNFQKAGYDGIKRKDSEYGMYEYVVFNPNQIKSIDNNGNWSLTSDNINEVKEPNLNQNFWKWFGDSVCIDDTGAPKILYHGTSSDFKEFKTDLIFTCDDPNVASEYGSIGAMPVFVKMRKPFIVDAFNQSFNEIYNAEGFKKKYKDLTEEDYQKLFKTYNYFESLEDCKAYYEENKKYNPDDYINMARAYGQKPRSTNGWANYAKSKGYDGCIIKNVQDTVDISNKTVNEYIVWNSNQIKSVNNNGDWSEKDDIYESSNLNDKFWAWFRGSKIIDKDGKPLIVYHGSPYIFDNFDNSKIGTSTKKYEKEYHKSAQQGFFFSLDKDYIKGYGDNIYACYLKMVNPYTYDMSDYIASDDKLNEVLKYAKSNGYDGVIFKNIREVGSQKTTEFVVFDSNQIRMIKDTLTESYMDCNNLYESAFNYGILYHGTNNTFDNFSKDYQNGGYLGNGFYFTMSKNMARSYGSNIISAKLKYKNSFLFDNDILDEKSVIKMLSTIPNLDKNTIETNKNIYLKQIKDNTFYDANKNLFSYIDFYKGDSTKILKELGYDSIDNIERDSEFVVFEPEQIEIVKDNLNESSNLNDNFWKWFGNSKCVDEKGQPQVCIHRTKSDFNIFDISKSNPTNLQGKGFYFSTVDSDNMKKSFGKNIKKCYLSIQNPFLGYGKKYNRKEFEPYIEKKYLDIIFEEGDEIQGFSLFYTMMMEGISQKEIDTTEVLTKMGYDGIYMSENKVWVAFKSNQIKSINNNGNWSKKSNDINEDLFESSNLNDNFWNWFKGSKTVDEQGNPLIFYHGTKQPNITNFKAKYDDGLIFFAYNEEFAKQWASNAPLTPDQEQGVRDFNSSDDLANYRKEVMTRYKRDYGDNWADDEDLVKSAKWEIKEYENQRYKQMGIEENVIPVYIRATKIFNPEKDYNKVIKEIANHWELDLTSDYKKEYDEAKSEYEKVSDIIHKWFEEHKDFRNDTAMAVEFQKREDILTNAFNKFNEVRHKIENRNNHLKRIMSGAWIYFENPETINKIWELGYDAIELSEHSGVITTLAVREGTNQIKSIFNDGSWSDKTNIFEEK